MTPVNQVSPERAVQIVLPLQGKGKNGGLVPRAHALGYFISPLRGSNSSGFAAHL